MPMNTRAIEELEATLDRARQRVSVLEVTATSEDAKPIAAAIVQAGPEVARAVALSAE